VTDNQRFKLLRLLATRLERLPVDSHFAHRASGLRGNTLKVLEEAKTGEVASERLDLLIKYSFEFLREAAREIPDIEPLLKEVQDKG
jgi:hypothetical protein